MEKLVGSICGLSGADIEVLEQLQKELVKQQDFLSKSPDVEVGLAMLDLKRHSLGALHFLFALANKPHDKEHFIRQTSTFLVDCISFQVSIDPKKFAFVCKQFVQNCHDLKKPICAVYPLRAAISKIGSKDFITPQHAQFALACILAKTYKAALPILDRFDYKIDPDKTGLTGEDVRLFFYYGGICYIAQKQYMKALQFFENVISAPAITTSAIMVEAYKKHTLISLLHLGQAPSLPKYTHSAVSRVCKQVCGAYEELATAFITQSTENLGKVADSYAEVFLKDGNMGLVGQVVSALKRQNIQRLTKTYITVPLSTVVEKHQFQDRAAAEHQLRKMIESGSLHATINDEHAILAFTETDDETYNTSCSVEYLGEQITSTMVLHRQIAAVDRDIELSDKFVRKVLSQERGGKLGTHNDGSADAFMTGFSG
eukprot:TRINITY_DN11287_c0_g1_i1.p1 TRINITY_DN11287_c0_g1~~TRINITY_DN11287_c0_g1_i1.p1  ORF type:complete len:436 (-),score=83.85 TRINITY_DN11287_c0_g1_i1:92-1378(-)